MEENQKRNEEERLRALFTKPEDPGWTDAMVAVVNAAAAKKRDTMQVAVEDVPKKNKHVSFAEACLNHRRRKWDAVGRALIALILTSATYGFAVIGLCPVSVAAVAMMLISGYTLNMGAIVLQEVVWYQRHVARKKVRG